MDLKISKQVAKESAKEITELKKQISSDKEIHISLLKDTLNDLREQNKFIKKIIFILSGIILLLIMSIVEFELIFTTINFKLWHFIVLGLIGSLFSQIGDIFESYLKRKANMKDSGDSLPGHGGYLDRIDSHLFNVLVIFIFCIIIL